MIRNVVKLATRRTRLLLATVCVFLTLAPPSVALAASYTYASGINGQGGTYRYYYWNSYLYNQVWHAQYYHWYVAYVLSDGSKAGEVSNWNNPTKWPYSIGYAQPECTNLDDYSGVRWTCQYGR